MLFTSILVSFMMAILGACVGSFLNVMIVRIPQGNFFAHVRSRCNHCLSQIPMQLNVPIFSYFFLKGRSKCCNKPIGIRYWIVEVMTTILFVFLYNKLSFYRTDSSLDSMQLIRFLHAAVFCSLLLVCSAIDLEHMIIPDWISIPAILVTPLIVALHPELGWRSSLYGVLFGFLSLYLVAWIYWAIRREVGLGFGDVKLMAWIGGWLGVEAVLPTLFIGSLIGSVFGVSMMLARREANLQTALPFGPFLACGAVCYFLFEIGW